jgi:hypothetical protein
MLRALSHWRSSRMQLLLSFAEEPLNQATSSPDVWQTLNVEQRNETLAVLARLLSKAAASARANPRNQRRGKSDE